MMRTMLHPRITFDPAIMLGKPCIKGTRITVELILRWLSEGRTFDELLEAYPHIAEEDIKAALAYAADTIGAPESCPRFRPVPARSLRSRAAPE
jgi:uncharacterized protein (DUF433 family)